MAEAKDQKEADSAPAAPSGPKGPLLLALVNTVAVLGVLGLLIYTQLIYKRPVITEQGERTRLAKVHSTPTPAAAPELIHFDPVTVNIQANPANPRPADGTPQQLQGKLHYATLGFAIEVRDLEKKQKIESLRPVLMDRILALLGRKSFHELSTVQGRYVLRTQIIETINSLMTRDQPQDPAMREIFATNVFFTQFIVQ